MLPFISPYAVNAYAAPARLAPVSSPQAPATIVLLYIATDLPKLSPACMSEDCIFFTCVHEVPERV